MYPSLEGNKFHIFKAKKYIANKIQKCQSGENEFQRPLSTGRKLLPIFSAIKYHFL